MPGMRHARYLSDYALSCTVGYTRRRKAKQKHNTICVGHHYMQTNTKNANKTRFLLQTTRGKDEQNIVFMRKLQRTLQHETQKVQIQNSTTQKIKKMRNTDPTNKPGVNSGALEG